MTKLSIVAAPTFKAKVSIPVAGSAPVDVEFTFKHRTKAALAEFTASRAEKSDLETFLDMVCGWDFAEEFSAETAETMLQNFVAAPVPIFRAYIEEMYQAKEKN